MTHGVFIRFHYEKDDPRWAWRVAWFRAATLESLIRQKDQEFDIWVRVNPWHEEEVRRLHPRIKTYRIRDEIVRYKENGRFRYFHDFVEWSRVEGVPMYDIQTSIDSDDWAGEDFTAMIRKAALDNAEDLLHIHFQPRLMNLKTMQFAPMWNYKIRGRGSAFYSLVQRKKEDYKYIHCASHMVMPSLAKKTISLPEGHCWATAHFLNESTGK